MAETLQLTHTLGRTGWQVAHAGGAAEFALAAVGQCFAQRRLLFNLPLLWKLRSLWTTGMSGIDPRALRLAMCVDERVRVSGAQLQVRFRVPLVQKKALLHRAGGRAFARALSEHGNPDRQGKDLHGTLPLPAQRGTDPHLPAPGDGLAWRVHALSAEGVSSFRKLAKGFARLPKGTQVQIRVIARSSRSPRELRAGFPLRVDLRLDPSVGYLTLVPLRRLVIAPLTDDAHDAEGDGAAA